MKKAINHLCPECGEVFKPNDSYVSIVIDADRACNLHVYCCSKAIQRRIKEEAEFRYMVRNQQKGLE